MASINGFSSQFRMSGLASGLDTDSMVKQIMRAERIPLDRLLQKKQLIEWKTTAYRDITNLLRKVKDDYFNIVKPSTNMLSQVNYKAFKTTVQDSVTAIASTAVSAVSSESSLSGEYTVEVLQLASATQRVSAAGVTRALTANTQADWAGVAGKGFTVTLDGVAKVISFNQDGSDSNLAGLNTLLEGSFGAGRLTATETSPGSGILSLTTGDGATKVTLTGLSVDDALTRLQFASGDTNRISSAMTLQELGPRLGTPLAFDAGYLRLTINGQEFSFSQYETLGSMVNRVNGDGKAQVTLRYNELTDKFTLSSDVQGSTWSISTSEATSSFFTSTGLTASTEVRGKDARVMVNTVLLTRSTNAVAVDGITFNLNATTANPVKIKLELDADKTLTGIKAFVEAYNGTISEINKRVAEPYDKEFPPLTDEQRENMSEDQIEKWEERAKTGLLRNDRVLQDILSRLRQATVDAISGATGGLAAIGITTGNYTEKGKLIINETKLREAILNDPDQVVQVFARKATLSYTVAKANGLEQYRYREQGIAYRLADVVEDYIRTIRDQNNNKGILLEKAGITGDLSEFRNSLAVNITNVNKQITSLTARLARRENSYYRRFAALERYMQQSNNQATWLAQQFSSN